MPQVLKAHVKEEILKSGLSEFYKTGYDKSKIRDIAIKSNVSPGNIYRYFTNKEQLFNAIVTPVFNELKIMFKKLNASEASSIETLEKDFTDMLVKMIKQHRYEIHIILSNETILPQLSKELNKMMEDVILTSFKLKSANDLSSNEKIMVKTYAESIKKGIVKIIKETNTKTNLDTLIGDFIKYFLAVIYEKIILIPAILIILTFLFTGCSSEPVSEKEKEISVATIVVESTSLDSIMNYVGVVRSNQLKNYSFKTSGYIDSIFVNKSQKIAPGDSIASMDTTDMEFQMSAAKNNMDSAYSQYKKALNGADQEDIANASLNVDKAKSVYEFNKNNYNDMTRLFEESVVSLSSLEQAKLSLDISEKEYLQAVELFNKVLEGSSSEDIQSSYSIYLAAKNTYEGYKSLIDDSILYSDSYGTVLSILNEEGDAVASGYPVVIVSSNELVVEVGVSIKDVYKLDLNIKSKVEINHLTFNGTIDSISKVPDPNSLTYLVTINLDSSTEDILIGSTAKIDFMLGKLKVYGLDISTVLNDGEDYVYLIEDGRASRKDITIININGDKLLVEGIYPGAEIITLGLDNVLEGYRVKNQDR